MVIRGERRKYILVIIVVVLVFIIGWRQQVRKKHVQELRKQLEALEKHDASMAYLRGEDISAALE